MTIHQPILVQPAGGDPSLVTTGQEFRNYTRAMMVLGDILGAQGVCGTSGGNALQVTQRGAGANLSADVGSGQALVVGGDITSQGTYHVWSDATVNVPGITVPGAGTFHHRIVLQVQDKLANSGLWSGYTAAITLLLDTGGGLPAEPNSAITLATIDVPAGSASVTNAMINDFRVLVGQQQAFKAADLARPSTVTLADDPDLQLLNLAGSVRYWVEAFIVYNGGTSTNEGDLQWSFRMSAGASGQYTADRLRVTSGDYSAGFASVWTDSGGAAQSAQTLGTTTDLVMHITGQLQTSSRPAFLVFQWAQGTSKATATTIRSGSWIRAARLK